MSPGAPGERRKRFLRTLALGLAGAVIGAELLRKVERAEAAVEPRSFTGDSAAVVFRDGSVFCVKDGYSESVYEFSGAYDALIYAKNLAKGRGGGTVKVKAGAFEVSRTFPDEDVYDLVELVGEGPATKIVPSGSFDAVDPFKVRVRNLVWRDRNGVDHFPFDRMLYVGNETEVSAGERDLSALVSLLRAVQELGIGKSARLGFGAVQVESVEIPRRFGTPHRTAEQIPGCRSPPGLNRPLRGDFGWKRHWEGCESHLGS